MSTAPIPADDLTRSSTTADVEAPAVPHLGLAGDTYTVLLSGRETAGRYCLIDMHVPPGGGPPPHRHDFEESFTVLDGQIVVTFRGQSSTVATGQTVHVPANAPHRFVNASDRPVRLLCICAPAGQEELFAVVGDPVPTRASPPPPLDAAAKAERQAKAAEWAPRFKTEFVTM